MCQRDAEMSVYNFEMLPKTVQGNHFHTYVAKDIDNNMSFDESIDGNGDYVDKFPVMQNYLHNQ